MCRQLRSKHCTAVYPNGSCNELGLGLKSGYVDVLVLLCNKPQAQNICIMHTHPWVKCNTLVLNRSYHIVLCAILIIPSNNEAV